MEKIPLDNCKFLQVAFTMKKKRGIEDLLIFGAWTKVGTRIITSPNI